MFLLRLGDAYPKAYVPSDSQAMFHCKKELESQELLHILSDLLYRVARHPVISTTVCTSRDLVKYLPQCMNRRWKDSFEELKEVDENDEDAIDSEPPSAFPETCRAQLSVNVHANIIFLERLLPIINTKLGDPVHLPACLDTPVKPVVLQGMTSDHVLPLEGFYLTLHRPGFKRVLNIFPFLATQLRAVCFQPLLLHRLFEIHEHFMTVLRGSEQLCSSLLCLDEAAYLKQMAKSQHGGAPWMLNPLINLMQKGRATGNLVLLATQICTALPADIRKLVTVHLVGQQVSDAKAHTELIPQLKSLLHLPPSTRTTKNLLYQLHPRHFYLADHLVDLEDMQHQNQSVLIDLQWRPQLLTMNESNFDASVDELRLFLQDYMDDYFSTMNQ